MLVDDERDILTVVAEYLRRWQFEVYPFSDPRKALEYFEKNPSFFSLVLADIRMPGMTGLELGKSILRLNPKMKMLLMTAFETLEEKVSADLPVVKYQDIIRKPFQLIEVCGAIKKQLQYE